MVGLLHAQDNHHQSTVTALKASAEVGRALCATWEVVGEAYTLIRMRMAPHRDGSPARVVLRWARESGVTLLTAIDRDHDRAAALLERYYDQPLSYVDALLLAVSERHRVEEVLTVDGRHFRAVRLEQNPLITVV